MDAGFCGELWFCFKYEVALFFPSRYYERKFLRKEILSVFQYVLRRLWVFGSMK